MPKKQDKSYHEGANDERTVVLAKIRREKKKFLPGMSALHAYDELEAWLLQRNERYKKRKGGL